MNTDLREAFSRVKPLCDLLMCSQSVEAATALKARVAEIQSEVLKDMHTYLLYPVITHLKSKEIRTKQEFRIILVGVMKEVANKITMNNVDVFLKYHTRLLTIVFDKTKPEMVTEAPEDLKLEVMETLTILFLNLDQPTRCKLLETQIPLLAQTIFVAVHMAKMEKLRALRLMSIQCVTAYTLTHSQLKSLLKNEKQLESNATTMVARIIPGVVGALTEVACSRENIGHSVIVAAVNAIRCIICLVMNNKNYQQKENVSIDDFANIIKDKEKFNNDKQPDAPLSPAWFERAGDRLRVVPLALAPLRTHDHPAVRRALALFATALLLQCSGPMQPSVPLAVDMLIALSDDEDGDVAALCAARLQLYFDSIPAEQRYKAYDALADNFGAIVDTLPGVMNNIDSARKLSALSLLHGYTAQLCGGRGRRLAAVLSAPGAAQRLAAALAETVRLDCDVTVMARRADADVREPPPSASPWARLRHLDGAGAARVAACCRRLGAAAAAPLLADRLLDMLDDAPHDRNECVWLLNHMGSAAEADPSLARRILDRYLEPALWCAPLEVAAPPPAADRALCDAAAWDLDSVPGLFEGAIETRYTDIPYSLPRPVTQRDPSCCLTLAEAQSNMVLACLLTEGVGMLASRLGEDFQPYLLKCLTLILERVGSQYSLLAVAGAAAAARAAAATGRAGVPELLSHNSDYITFQITTRLKKKQADPAPLRVLGVLLEYGGGGALTSLGGVVADVLLQSCDKNHAKDLSAYLQVFLTFVTCIQKWFPAEEKVVGDTQAEDEYDLMSNVREFIKQFDIAETFTDDEGDNKTAQEMYEEDQRAKETEDVLNYDDKVSEEKPPPPQHIKLTVDILKRCLNFIPSKRQEEQILSLQVAKHGLLILRDYEDELLPMVHQIWSPLVVRFAEFDRAVVVRSALEVLVTMAEVSKDFIRSRTIKEVLPNLLKYLDESAARSHLQDVGSAYRASAAYTLQLAALRALPALTTDLSLGDSCQHMTDVMETATRYLSDLQPKPLQASAVDFFRGMLRYDRGAAWLHLQRRGAAPPAAPPAGPLPLRPAPPAPADPSHRRYSKNIKLIMEEPF